MSTKNVAVRLIAEGGQRVRAELQGIGDTGEKSFDGIGKAADRVSGILRRTLIGLAASLGSGALFTAAMREAEQFETTMFRIDAIIKATGGAAGRSADQLREQAREIARGTLESTEGVLRAQQTLLTFRKVQGQVFDDTIAAAADMAAALGTDMNSAVMQLGKALEDPVRGMTALSRSGTVFTEAQRAMVKEMVETGRQAEAQRFILRELEAQYGGAARAAAGGLAGAQDSLAQSMQEVRLAIASSFGVLQIATAAYNAMARAADFVAENMDRVRAYAIAAATFFTAVKIPAIIALTAAAGRLVLALVATRAAMMRTGILILVVAAGEAIIQMEKLIERVGGFGEAMSKMGDLASAVWEYVKTSAASIVPAMNAVWKQIEGGFFDMLASVQKAWGEFLQNVGARLAQVPGASGTGTDLWGAGMEALSKGSAFEGRASRARAEGERIAAGAAAAGEEAAAKVRAAWEALTTVVENSSSETEDATNRVTDAVNELEESLKKAGGAAKGAGDKSKDAAEEALTGWDALIAKVREYAEASRDVGAEVGDAIVGAMRRAEDAVATFVTTGKLSFSDMVKSMIADLARLATRRFITGPLTEGLLGAFGGAASGGGLFGRFFSGLRSFDGGGWTGSGPRAGGLDGRGGFMAMVHPQERIVDYSRGGRGRAGEMAPVTVNFNVRDAESYRQSRAQIASDLARAVAMGRRGM